LWPLLKPRLSIGRAFGAVCVLVAH
jgi:hypothetical protein